MGAVIAAPSEPVSVNSNGAAVDQDEPSSECSTRSVRLGLSERRRK